MDADQVKQLLDAEFTDAECVVSGENAMFDVRIISSQFTGLNAVKRQQSVYAPLKPAIKSGEIHAVSIKVFTPEEWQKKRKLSIS